MNGSALRSDHGVGGLRLCFYLTGQSTLFRQMFRVLLGRDCGLLPPPLSPLDLGQYLLGLIERSHPFSATPVCLHLVQLPLTGRFIDV